MVRLKLWPDRRNAVARRSRRRMSLRGCEQLELRQVFAADPFPSVQSISLATSTPTAANSISWTVTFSESVTGVDKSDFAVALSGLSPAPSLSVTGTGAKYTVTANNVAGAGTIGLDLVDDGTIRDGTKNPLVSSNAALSLQGQQTFATGTGPQSVAVGDFNKDGNLDLVAANYGTFLNPGNTLSVLLGKGDGTFGAQKTFAVGTSPSSVAVGDINLDGNPDLVATNYFSNTLSVLLGKGDGTFGAQQTFATGSGPTSVAIGELNSDGKPDLAVANYGSNTVGVFLNKTSGSATTASFNGQETEYAGNGPRSVAIGQQYESIDYGSIYTANYGTSGEGNTVFWKPNLLPSQFRFSTGSGPYSVGLSDFFSVITANYGSAGGGSTITIGLGPRPGVTPVTYATGKGPAAVVVGDYNCDGTPDIAVANSGDGTLGVLLGNSDQTLQAQQTFAVGTNPQAVASGDFNKDGRLDLVAANLGLFGAGNSLSVLLNGQTGNFTGAVATVDTITPSVQSISLVGSAVTNATSISWAVTFSEPVTGVDAGDFSVALSGVTAALPLAVTGSGTSYTVTANTVAGAGTIGLNLVSNGTIRDQVNNPMSSGSFTGAVATVDTILPSVQSISLVGSSPTTASSISWTVEFSEPVTGVDAGDFAVALSGVTAALPLAVIGSGTTYTVTANTVAGTGTIGLNLIDDGTIRDQANNPLGNPAAPASYAAPVTFAIGASPTVIATGDLNNDGRPDLAFLQPSAGAVSVFLNTTAPGDATPTYAPEVTFAAGASPISLAIGDLNGDGRPDLAIANLNSSTVSVLLNTTGTKAMTPSYAPQATFATGTNPLAVAIGDLNGDGKPDLAVANYKSNTLSVLLSTTATNAISPSYAAQVTVYGGGSPSSVAICDLNADGKPDLAVANRNSNTMTVLLSTNATTPAYAAPATFATGTNPDSISIGDLNADGRPDIAVNNGNAASVSVYLNTMGANATKASYANQVVLSTGEFPQAVSIGDLNGDGRPDLAFATAGDSVANVLLSTTATGATAPSYAAPATFAAGSSPSSVIGDFNGDGRTDLAIASRFPDSVSVLLGNQTGSFTGAVATIDHLPPSVQSISLVGSPVTNATSISWVVTFSEPVTGVDASDFQLLPSSGVTAALPVTVTGGGTTYWVTATQVSGTGTVGLNLVSDGTIRDQVNNPLGSGSFTGAVATVDTILPFVQSISLVGSPVTNAMSISWTVTFSEPVTGVDASDFQLLPSSGVTAGAIEVTGSGTTYTVTATHVSRTAGTIGLNLIDNSTIRDQANNPLGNPNAPASYAAQATFATGKAPASVSIGDLNGDGRPDLVTVSNYSGTVSVLLNTTPPGATPLSYAAQTTFAVGSTPNSVSMGDFNGDGKPDLAVVNSESNSVSVLLNTTAPGATTPSYAAQVTFATGPGPFSVSISDVNADGRPDLAIANLFSKFASVLLNTTAPGAIAPTYAAQATFTTGLNPRAISTGDFNGDGKPDLAIVNQTSNSVSVLLNTTAPEATTPTYSAQATFATGLTPQAVAIGDVNADGRPDLVVANVTSNSLSVLLNATAPGATTPVYVAQATFATGRAPTSVSIGDLNGDGRPDLAFTNGIDSTVSVLLNTMDQGATSPVYAAQSTFSTGGGPASVTIGDLNGDGRPDLAFANGSNSTVSVLLGDQSGSFTGAVATVDVAPTDISVSPAAVPENASTGTLVGTLSSTDAYQGDTFTYSLVSGAGSADNASFAIVGDRLNTNAVFDYETKNSYSIRVRTTDSFGQSFEKPLTISVTNVPDGAPVFTSGSTGIVTEQAPAGTPIYEAVASLGDTATPNNKITYSIDAGSPDVALVSIDPVTGVVTLNNAADYETTPFYEFTVVATDKGNRQTSQKVGVNVEDINEFAPVFSSGTTGVVAEGAPTRTAIYTAQATDADGAHNQITYSIKPDLFDAAAVTIDPTTGAVTLLNAASLSGKSSYTFVVIATDGGTPANATEQGVTVTVTERNLYTPVFSSGSTGTVAEMSPTSTVIYTAAATDADSSAPNNVVHYSIKPEAYDADLVTIDPQTGAVTLKAAADYETRSSLSFIVIATDGGNPANSAGQAVTIAVTNVAPTAGVVSTALGFFKAGDTIMVRVTFNEPVFVTGLPQIALTVGSTVWQAVYSAGSGTAVLWFSHTIAAGENDTDGVAVGELTLPGGATIKDGTGVDATTSASNVVATPPSYTSGVVVDTIQPVLQGLTGPSPGTYASGQKLSFTVTFSEPVSVTGVPYLDLKVNGVARRAVYDGLSGTNQLVFSYTVAVGETAAAGKVVATGRSIQLPAGAAVTDRARNAAVSLAYTPPGTSGVKVDGVVPVAASVTAPAAKTYREGQALVFKVNYSRAVYVNGTPQLTVSIGGVFRQAAYIGGAGTKILSFRYLVATGDLSVQRVVLGNTVGLSGGWIRDAVGNNARLTLPAANTNGVLVDAVSPTITGLTIPAAGTYKKGQTLSFTVTFSEPMVVTGVPKLQAVIGSTVRNIAYVRGTGTRSLVFSYTLQASDHDADGIALLSQIVLGTGTIRDKAGNPPTSLTLPVVSTSGVKVS